MAKDSPEPEAEVGARSAMRLGLAICLLGFLALWAVWVLWQKDFSLVPASGLFLAMLVSAVSLVTAAWRIQVLSRGVVGLATGCKSIALVSSLLIVFPSRLSDLIKPVYLSERAGIALSQGFSILFYERALDVIVMLGMLVLLLVGQGVDAGDGLLRSAVFLGVLSLGLVAFLAALILEPGLVQRVISAFPLAGARAMVERFIAALSDTSTAPVLAGAGGLSVVAWVNSYLIFYVYLIALNAPDGAVQIDALAVLLVFIAGALGLFVTVTPGGIGTYELAIALALVTCGVPIVEGLVHGLILRLIVFVPNLVLLVYIVAYDGLGLRALYRRIGQLRRTRNSRKDTP